MTDPEPVRPQQHYVSLYTDLLSTVRELGLLERRRGYYCARFIGIATMLAGIAVGVTVVGDSWFQLVFAVLLALTLVQVAFLSHDSAHKQIFASAQWNDRTARVLAGAVLGMSVSWWNSEHIRHHAKPNQLGKDPDVIHYAHAYTPDAVLARGRVGQWIAARQGWLFFPLLTLEGLGLHVVSMQYLCRRGATKRERRELGVVVPRLSLYVAALYLLMPPGKAAAFLGLQMAVLGVCLGAAFAPNHKGMPLVPADMKLDFLRRQVLMSRNIRGGAFVDFVMGGLNYQIEHHLFPSMPRPTLPRVQPIVREYCATHGIDYTEVGLLQSYGIIVRYLNNVGLKARDPFQCPLAAELRTTSSSRP